MMKLARSVSALVLALVVSACAKDTFNSRSPKLIVTAVTEGRDYVSFDDGTRTINVGEVPVYAAKTAVWKLENPSGERLLISKLELIDHAGEQWGMEIALPSVSQTSAWPKILEPYASTQLQVTYAPLLMRNADTAKVGIFCDATEAVDGYVDVNVEGTGGDPIGAPDIEVAYNTYAGPAGSDCATSFDGSGNAVVENDAEGNPIINVCRISEANALDFGNIGLGATGTVRLRVRNAAECPAIPGIGSCQSCELVIDKDAARENIGLGFKPGTNNAGLFSFAGSTSTPARIRQENVDCGEDGEVSLSLVFNAPVTEGAASTVVVIESNDPDEPALEIPVRAFARNAPIAIAKFRAFSAAGQPFTDPSHIEPLDHVHFDGRGSYDPRDPADASLIVNYKWQVIEYPTGTNPNDFQPAGQGTGLFSMFIPLAGHYVVKLVVTNSDDIESGDTPDSRVEFDAVPSQRLHVQLVWDNATNDQDLHLSNIAQDARLCNTPNDCYFSNKKPVWFSGTTAGNGPNPSLDIDDTDGLGPENINIDEPRAGTFRIYVHNYRSDNSTTTRATLRVFLNGVQRAEYRRTLKHQDDVWAAGDIIWLPDNTGSVTPYPSDTNGEIGAVKRMTSCSPPGWTFP